MSGKHGRGTIIALSVLLVLLVVLIYTRAFGLLDNTDNQNAGTPDISVSASQSPSPKPGDTPIPSPSSSISTQPAASPTTQPESGLVPYYGPVEHLFFHPLIAYPELAFDGDYMSDGLDDWMVTANEFRKMIESIYNNGYILVDINSVYSEAENEAGVKVMKRNRLMLPPGKKPLIISLDDVNYLDYMRENGIVYKLILDGSGNIAAWGLDPDGNEVISYDLDAVTIIDAFVSEHPDFSLNGAKGCIGLTGYQGILGYRTQRDSPDRKSEIEAVKPVIERLKQTGWTFASHTYWHPDLSALSFDEIAEDTYRWLDEVGALIGGTSILFYPYGSRVDENDSAVFKYLQSVGFRQFYSVGIEPYVNIHTNSPAVCGDRMHPDGVTLRNYRELYLRFYDAAEVMDLDVRPEKPYKW
ncbi:MAG: polysaccharide deacetylase family protein [Oscillospiraceae bacterium]|jgi:hypothetical protein